MNADTGPLDPLFHAMPVSKLFTACRQLSFHSAGLGPHGTLRLTQCAADTLAIFPVVDLGFMILSNWAILAILTAVVSENLISACAKLDWPRTANLPRALVLGILCF